MTPEVFEELLKSHCRKEKYSLMAEHRFHPSRRFRFDYAIPEIMTAIEIEGGLFIHGRHTSPMGYHRDCDKYNDAQLLGWRVFRVTTLHFKKDAENDLINLVDRIFLSKKLEKGVAV